MEKNFIQASFIKSVRERVYFLILLGIPLRLLVPALLILPEGKLMGVSKTGRGSLEGCGEFSDVFMFRMIC